MNLNKNSLIENINRDLPDNSTKQISPYDIRHNLIDIIDSIGNLLSNDFLNTQNFSTPNTRSTRVGVNVIEDLLLNNYETVDNSALGFEALRSNYQGQRNTAIGVRALSCNIHGDDNLALGCYALAGNNAGFGNVGIGNYSLNYNKRGDFNIAIGHGAGYYADDNTNYKFYLGSHPINSQYICDNPRGSGLVPLAFGDLQNNVLAINSKTLHYDAVLQTSGNIAPSLSNSFDLGSSSYRWSSLFLSNAILFETSKIASSNSGVVIDGILNVSGNFMPTNDNLYDMGSNSLKWASLFVQDLFVSGQARMNRATFTEQTHYLHKTIHLASSGFINTLDGGGPSGLYDYYTSDSPDPVPYLSDEQLDEAGIKITSSGLDKYHFVFNYGSGVCSDPFKRWNSNLPIEISSGNYLVTPAVISPDSCYGLHFLGDDVYFSSKSSFNNVSNTSGVSDFNLITDKSDNESFEFNIISPNSGVNIVHNFFSRASGSINGFSLTSYDEYNSTFTSTEGFNLDRFAITSHDNGEQNLHSVIIMKNEETGGLFGINNLSNSHLVLPNTIFNVRSNDSAVARITSEVDSYCSTSLQLLTNQNCLQDGFELTFNNSGHFVDFNVYENSGITNFARMTKNSSISKNSFGVLAGESCNEMFTIGSAATGSDDAVLSMFENNYSVSGTPSYGKLYVEEDIGIAKSHVLWFVDGSGNKTNLIAGKNGCDYTSETTFSDEYRNLSIGKFSMISRCSTGFNDNTAFGFGSLFSLTTGDYNTVVGSLAGSGISSGRNNIAIGYKALSSSSHNISNNIVIGNNIGNYLSTSYNLLVGVSDSLPLVSGTLGPLSSNRAVFFPNGKVNINSGYLNVDNGSTSTRITSNVIELSDVSSNFPSSSLSFKFTGSGVDASEKDLLTLNHNASGMVESASYDSPSSPRPYAELKGDLKLLGAIRFRDGTSMETSPSGDIAHISGVAYTNRSDIDALFVEGFAQEKIDFATSYSSPNSGIILDSLSNSYFIHNRDQNTVINSGDFIIAIHINNEYRPIWISNDSSCNCCVR